jgi:tRNA(Ser,Leu) C12 N-acetylase TAN1
MTASKSLPDRPSLESIRKQAKKLAREIAAGKWLEAAERQRGM